MIIYFEFLYIQIMCFVSDISVDFSCFNTCCIFIEKSENEVLITLAPSYVYYTSIWANIENITGRDTKMSSACF